MCQTRANQCKILYFHFWKMYHTVWDICVVFGVNIIQFQCIECICVSRSLYAVQTTLLLAFCTCHFMTADVLIPHISRFCRSLQTKYIFFQSAGLHLAGHYIYKYVKMLTVCYLLPKQSGCNSWNTEDVKTRLGTWTLLFIPSAKCVYIYVLMAEHIFVACECFFL